MNPYDGLRAEQFSSVLDGKHRLYLAQYLRGERTQTILVREYPLDLFGCAKVDRDYYMLQSLCRYLNSLGNLDSLQSLLKTFGNFVCTYHEPVADDSAIHIRLEVEEPTYVFLGQKGECTVVRECESVETVDLIDLADVVDVTPSKRPAEA